MAGVENCVVKTSFDLLREYGGTLRGVKLQVQSIQFKIQARRTTEIPRIYSYVNRGQSWPLGRQTRDYLKGLFKIQKLSY